MPDTPATARFLTDEERDWALRRMRLDAHGATNVNVDEEGFDWYWVKMALKAPQTYFNGFIWFFLLVSTTWFQHEMISDVNTLRSLSTPLPCSSHPLSQAWVTTRRPLNSSPFLPIWPPSSP